VSSKGSKKRLGKGFSIGEKLVYPPYGVGVIEDIEEMEIEGKKSKFVILRMLESEMVVKIPVDRLDKIGVRKVLSGKSLDEVISILTSIPDMKENHKEKVSWTVKHRKFLDKVKTGDLKIVAEVYRDLMLLSKIKDLSYGEKNILDMAENMLVFEIAEAKGVSREEARSMLRSFFKTKDIAEEDLDDENKDFD